MHGEKTNWRVQPLKENSINIDDSSILWLILYYNYTNTVHVAAEITQGWFSNLFLVSQNVSDYLWADVDMHVFVSVLNWIKCEGESAGSWCWNEQDGLMCSQQTASDPSSACLNWAPGLIQCGVYLQYTALYKSLLCRRPLQRGHCSSFIHPWMHSWTVHGRGHTNSLAHTRTHARHTLLLSRPVQRAKLGTPLHYWGVTGTDSLNAVHQTDQLCV